MIIQKLRYYLFSFLTLMPLLALAQTPDLAETSGLKTAGQGTGLLQGVSAKQIVVNIINGLLSVLGLLFVVLIIWGGFRWMTSQGNSQQVDEAKAVIKNATIGLVIVMTSYIIVIFIFKVLLNIKSGGSNPDPIE